MNFYAIESLERVEAPSKIWEWLLDYLRNLLLIPYHI